MSQQQDIQEMIFARAVKDDKFRQELLNNPKAIVERELGIKLSPEMTIQVHEETPTIMHLVLPLAPKQMSEKTTTSKITLQQFRQTSPDAVWKPQITHDCPRNQ